MTVFLAAQAPRRIAVENDFGRDTMPPGNPDSSVRGPRARGSRLRFRPV